MVVAGVPMGATIVPKGLPRRSWPDDERDSRAGGASALEDEGGSGVEDRVLNVGATDVLEQLMQNVTTIKMEGIGHLPQLEAPKQTAEDLKAFIAGLEQ